MRMGNEECPTAGNKKELFRVASSKILDFRGGSCLIGWQSGAENLPRALLFFASQPRSLEQLIANACSDLLYSNLERQVLCLVPWARPSASHGIASNPRALCKFGSILLLFHASLFWQLTLLRERSSATEFKNNFTRTDFFKIPISVKL